MPWIFFYQVAQIFAQEGFNWKEVFREKEFSMSDQFQSNGNQQPAGQPVQQPAGQPNQQPAWAVQVQPAQTPKGKSALGIAGFVVGIIALITSLIPIVNNGSAFLAVLGLIFAIIGLVGIIRGKKKGKGITIAAIVICVIAFIAVMASQSMYSQAIDDATSGAKATSVTQSDGSKSQSDKTTDLSLGTTIDLSNNVSVCANSIQKGLTNYDGSELVCVTVTYVNNGKENATFNMYDWKAEDSQGAQRTATAYSKGENPLNSGTLAPGGTVTGEVYFSGAPTKVVYQSTSFSNSNTFSWVLS